MQVAFHVGVHGSDENGIRACLELNRGTLAEHGVELSSNSLSEPIMNEALRALKGGVASREMEDVVRDALIEGEGTRRLILSRASMLGVPRRALTPDGLFATAGAKMRALADVLPGCEAEFFLALRNPAVLVPEIASRRDQPVPAEAVADDYRWLPTVQAILRALGGRRLVMWCHEDSAFVLPEAIRLIAGLPADAALTGDNPVLDRLLSDHGKGVVARRMKKIAPGDTAARRAMVAEVLIRHHEHKAVVGRIDMPGWDQTAVDHITAAYDADVATIAALPGVEFLIP